jgi:hypothetical protein
VINVPFPRAMSFSASPLSIRSGTSGIFMLNLTGIQAPAGGLTVTLSSSDRSRATVPATVAFAAGGTTVPVPVTGVAPGTAVITASANINPIFNPATATASVTVTPPPMPTLVASYHANGIDFIDVFLVNTSAVTAVNLQIVSITKVTAAAPNVIVPDPNDIIPRRLGDLPGGQRVGQSFRFKATAGIIGVPFSFTITYQADNLPPQTAVIDVPLPR